MRRWNQRICRGFPGGRTRGVPIGGPVSKPGNQNARTHGARSEAAVKAREKRVKRSFLRVRSLTEADLDPLAIELLDSWAEARAQVELMNEYFARVGGMLDEEGVPRPATRTYWLARNSAEREKRTLETHLAKLGQREETSEQKQTRWAAIAAEKRADCAEPRLPESPGAPFSSPDDESEDDE
jgi:hypothetical protein